MQRYGHGEQGEKVQDNVGDTFARHSSGNRRPEDAVPEIKVVELQPHDRILLCTDGLYNAIEDDRLLHTLQCSKDLEQVADEYRARSEEKAGDNYTAIIVEME